MKVQVTIEFDIEISEEDALEGITEADVLENLTILDDEVVDGFVLTRCGDDIVDVFTMKDAEIIRIIPILEDDEFNGDK